MLQSASLAISTVDHIIGFSNGKPELFLTQIVLTVTITLLG